MKPKSIKSLLALALLAPGALFAQTTAKTTPVGYETITLAPNQYNLIGVRLFNAPVASGTFESSTAATLVDDQGAFSLNAAKTYIIEFPNGATILAPGSGFSGTTVSGLTGVTPALQSSYTIREATTISSVFGATNQAGLASSANADPTEADLIYLQDGAGFKRIFYSSYTEDLAFNGWLDADTFAKVDTEVIHPSEGLFVQTKVSTNPINLVVSGEVKKTPTAYVADQKYTMLSSVYPAGATLTTAGFSNNVQQSPNADPTEADKVLIPNGAGGYVRAFYSSFTEDMLFNGWLDADTFAQIPNTVLTTGFFIDRVGPVINGVNNTPTFYSTL